MDPLCISLFGSVQISHGSESHSIAITRIPQVLLAYLVLQPERSHPRSVLASLLWGDRSEEQARNCLNTALWRLRQALEPDGIARGTYLRTMPSGEIGFNPQSDYWLDASILERSAKEAQGHPIPSWTSGEAARLEAALQLYRGDLLEGCYDDWALRERERLRDLYLRSLALLMSYHRTQGDLERSILCGCKILYHDPLREEIHRELMQLYAETGRRALAIRQYETCCQLLARELGVPPMEETQCLAHTLLETPAIPQPTPHLPTPYSPTIEQVLQQFHDALRRLEEIQEEFRATAHLLEQYKRGSVDRTP